MMFVPFQQPHMAPVKQVAKRTKSACINCKAAKVGCSSERPCLWCLRHDLQDTCVDAPKKARNTKRRRSTSDDASSSHEATEDVPTPSPPPLSRNAPSSPHTKKPSSTTKRRAARGKPPPTEYDSPDSGNSDAADPSASSPPPSPFKLPSGSSSNLAYNQTGNFLYTHHSSYNPSTQMMVALPASSPSTSSTPTPSPSLSLPAPSSSPSSNMHTLTAFPPFMSVQQAPNTSSNQRYAPQNLMQHYQMYQNQQNQRQQVQPQHYPYQQMSQQPYLQPSSNPSTVRSATGSHLSNTDYLSPPSLVKHSPSLPPSAANSTIGNSNPIHNSFLPPNTTTSTTSALGSSIDSEEDASRSITETIDSNNLLIQSLLTSQLAMSQLAQAQSSNNSTNANSNGNKTNESNSTQQNRNSGGFRKSPILNTLLLDELASLQQCLETISALSQIQTGAAGTIYPSATLKLGTPITISNCNEPFSKLIGYDSCYDYFCNGDTSLESIILPQFITYVNRKVVKMANYAAPKLLRPTMIVTKQGELKCCYAMLRTDIYGEGLCNITIIKQGASMTNRFRRMMSEPSLLHQGPYTSQQLLQQTPQQQPQQVLPQQQHQLWEKKT